MGWDVYDHGLLPATGGGAAEATAEPKPSGPCQITIVDDTAGPRSASGAISPQDVCADDASAQMRRGNRDLTALFLVRPSVDDPFADLLPNLSAGAASDHAWAWSAPAGRTFTICERRLNDQLGIHGTCTRPLRIGWGLVPLSFTAGFDQGFKVAAGICALFMFGLVWTIVRFLFVLNADPHEQAGAAEQGRPLSTAPEEVWSSLDDAQKLALAQTAADGLPNPKNREAVADLLRQRVLTRRPEFSVTSPDVRKYVGSFKARSDIQELEKRIPPSDWSRWRGPLSVLLVCSVVFLFGIQQGLIDSATSLATGLTGTIGAVATAIARLSGIWKRGVSGILSDRDGGEKKP
jgi:hypothetical protein